MSIIQDSDRAVITKQLEGLNQPVKMINFSQEMECQFCKETSELVKELGQLSDKVESEVYDFVNDKEIVKKYNVEHIPSTILMGDNDRGIKFYGIPSGYEFATILETIKMISSGDSGLSQDTKDFLKDLKEPVNLKVFVTPTCPYCAPTVRMAFQMAYESPMVTAEAYEAIEFPHLSNKYSVQGVPRTVINDETPIEGAAPERMVIDTIKKAMEK